MIGWRRSGDVKGYSQSGASFQYSIRSYSTFRVNGRKNIQADLQNGLKGCAFYKIWSQQQQDFSE